jgi:glycosyltransferase involved in cell wall biosynthesis
MSPTVSLVMTAWNAERFLGEALESVVAQTQPPDEVVVVDDGSTDGTAALAVSFGSRLAGLQVLRREHEGIGSARNAGIAACTGQLVCFLDADDLWLPTKQARQLEAFAERPDLDAAFCLVDEFLDESAGDRGRAVRAPKARVSGALVSGAMLRRELLDRAGPFGTTRLGEWVAWWAQVRAVGVHEHVVPEVLIRRRIHDDNNSARESDDGAVFLAAARAHRRGRRGEA